MPFLDSAKGTARGANGQGKTIPRLTNELRVCINKCLRWALDTTRSSFEFGVRVAAYGARTAVAAWEEASATGLNEVRGVSPLCTTPWSFESQGSASMKRHTHRGALVRVKHPKRQERPPPK